jgi:hypothetical protein
MFDALRHALEQQRERIAEQLAAVVEAEAAVERMRQAFGLEDASSAAVEAHTATILVGRPADPPERVYGRLQGLGAATRTCAAPDRTAQFEAKGKRRYCSGRCRTRTASRAYAARKAERADAEWRARTEQLRQLHETEGYGSNGGTIMEYQ